MMSGYNQQKDTNVWRVEPPKTVRLSGCQKQQKMVILLEPRYPIPFNSSMIGGSNHILTMALA